MAQQLDPSSGLPTNPPDLLSQLVTALATTGGAPPVGVISGLTAHLAEAIRLARVAQRLHVSSEDALSTLESLADATPEGVHDPSLALSIDQERILREAGSLREDLPPLADRASTRTLAAGLALASDSLSVKQAAAALGVSEGRIRQRLAARTLFGIAASGGWRLPRFQFTEHSQLLRGMDQVLPVLPEDVHPVVVASFLARPHPDLVLNGEATSPAQWLEGGGRVETVVALAAGLHDLA